MLDISCNSLFSINFVVDEVLCADDVTACYCDCLHYVLHPLFA